MKFLLLLDIKHQKQIDGRFFFSILFSSINVIKKCLPKWNVSFSHVNYTNYAKIIKTLNGIQNRNKNKIKYKRAVITITMSYNFIEIEFIIRTSLN